MQRLYSMFPRGRPGLGMAVLRLHLAALLLQALWGAELLFALPAWGLALLLLAGFGTPLVAIACVCIGVAVALGEGLAGAPPLPLASVWCLLAEGLAVALLGPGGYSVDALRFGHREIVVPPSGR